MDRLTLTPEQQAFVENERANMGFASAGDAGVTGTNLVIDDHLLVDGQFKVIVVGGGSGDAPYCYVPEWGDFAFHWECVPYVGDRAGPQGQTMPVIAPVEPSADPIAAAKKEQP